MVLLDPRQAMANLISPCQATVLGSSCRISSSWTCSVYQLYPVSGSTMSNTRVQASRCTQRGLLFHSASSALACICAVISDDLDTFGYCLSDETASLQRRLIDKGSCIPCKDDWGQRPFPRINQACTQLWQHHGQTYEDTCLKMWTGSFDC